MILDIKENPFYILGASFYDDKEKIIELADKKYSSSNIGIIDEAKENLLDSNKRFFYELRWFHFGGISLEKLLIHINRTIQDDNYINIDILKEIEEKGNEKLMADIPQNMFISFAPRASSRLTDFNLDFYTFSYIKNNKHQIAELILSLVLKQSIIFKYFNEIINDINEIRENNKYNIINDPVFIESSKKLLENDLISLLLNKLKILKKEDIYEILKIIKLKTKVDNNYRNNQIINNLFSEYEDIFEKEKKKEIYNEFITIFGNPFYILNIDINDNKNKIISSCEDKMMFEKSDVIIKAQDQLLNPRKRLTAEIMWFSSCSNNQIKIILDYLKELPFLDKKHRLEIEGSYNEFHTGDGKDTGYFEGGIGNISLLDKFNIRFYSLPYLIFEKYENYHEYYGIITEIFLLYDNLKSNQILDNINQHRKHSGFPIIKDTENIDIVLKTYRDNIRKIFSKFFKLNEIQLCAKIVNFTLERLTRNDYILLDDFLSEYELLIKETTKGGLGLKDNIDKILKKQYLNDIDTSLIITLTNLKRWDFLVQPLQLNALKKGIRHEESYYFANKMRELALYCNNEVKRPDLALKIIKELKTIFAELPEFLSIIEKDENTLLNIQVESQKHQKHIEYLDKQKKINNRDNILTLILRFGWIIIIGIICLCIGYC